MYLWLCLSQPDGGNDRGWSRNRGDDSGHRLVRLRKFTATAEEGVVTCDIPGDNNTPRYLGVYYPSESFVMCILLIYMYMYIMYMSTDSFPIPINRKCMLMP